MDKISTVPVLVNKNNRQAGLPKNMVPNPGWFDRDRMKFKDWQRGMRLFLKSNRVIETDDRIITILACFRWHICLKEAQ